MNTRPCLRNLFVFVLCLALTGASISSCCSNSPADRALNDIESYINERPDSARTALQAMDAGLLRTKRLRARHALLHTMAQNKCYDDLTVPGLLEPASWYERHGTPDERLKYWMYRGRIQQAKGQINEAAVSFSHAEQYADKAQDKHTVGLLYLSIQGIYSEAYNWALAEEYAGKAIDLFKRTGDPATGQSLGYLASIYYKQEKWEQAESLYREAMPYLETVPALAPSFISGYAMVKLYRPEKDPAGAIALLDRYREITGGLGLNEIGAYAYALELLGKRKEADAYVSALRERAETDGYTARVWLIRIEAARGDYGAAFKESNENYRQEKEALKKALEDSVMQSLREESDRDAATARENLRLLLIMGGGVFFALLSLVLLLLLRRGKLRVERDRLVELREQMQEELEKVQSEKTEKEQLLSGQEDRIREMEEHVARERERFTRDRVSRLRQLGELRSTFWWRERGGMREADAIQRIKKEFSYVFQTDNDGTAFVRQLDEELNGAVSRLCDSLRLGRKPKEKLFVCCCILDLEPEMIAEIMDISKANVYEKRSRLRARVRALEDPQLSVLVAKKSTI